MTRVRLAILFFILATAAVVFQNCTGAGFMAAAPTNSTYSLPFNHPGVDVTSSSVTSASHLVMGDQVYLQSVMNDVFNASGQSAATANYIAAVVNGEYSPEQFMLGRACDPFQDGTLNNCNGQITNNDTLMLASSSAIREAARVQVCRRLLANDSVLANVVGKVQDDQDAPDETSINAAVQLFYPASDNALQVTPSLLTMDQTLAGNSETVNDRWRLIFLTLCESPTWQVL